MARKRSKKDKAEQFGIPFQDKAPETPPEKLFPQQLRPGDIVADGQGIEWEVIGNPTVYLQGKAHQVRVQKPGDPSTKTLSFYPAHERVTGEAGRPGGEVTPTASATRTELLVRDGDGKLVYRFTLPCDLVADPDYLKALVAGQQVAANGAGPLRQDAR